MERCRKNEIGSGMMRGFSSGIIGGLMSMMFIG